MIILLDLDSTLTNTSKAYFNYYREVTGDLSTTYSEDNIQWNMSNLCPLWSKQEQADNVYIQEDFFKHMELYPNAKEILHKLKDDEHYLHIVTCHNVLGSEYKLNWIRENLPMIDEVTIIPIESGIQKFDKSSIVGDIIIDDKLDCLETASTTHKLLYGNYIWNRNCDKYDRVLNWDEVYERIKKIGDC